MGETVKMEGRETLPTYRLSSRLVGGAAALEEFQEATAGAFTSIPEIVSRADFRIDLRGLHLGRLLMTEACSGPARFERSRRMIATTGTDHIYLIRYAEGGSSGTVEGRDFHVRSGDICFLDLTRVRETRSETFRNITLVIPRAPLEARGIDTGALHGLILPREQPLTRLLSDHLDSLSAHAGQMTVVEADMVGEATVSLVASLIERRSGLSTTHAPLHRRAEVLRYISAHLGDPDLTPSTLAERLGLSRAALYRMFEDDGGVAQLIRERRLTEAALALASPAGRAGRISQVARRFGFADDSSFSRAFRTHFGISPREARDRAGVVPNSVSNAGENAALAAWLRRLTG